MTDINVLLFGHFDGGKDNVAYFFKKAQLSHYDTPPSIFVTTRYKEMVNNADFIIMGGEPRYKSYITYAKRAGCKTALWGCKSAWAEPYRAALVMFDIIFASDKDAFLALKKAGYTDISVCPPPPPEGVKDSLSESAITLKPAKSIIAPPKPLDVDEWIEPAETETLPSSAEVPSVTSAALSGVLPEAEPPFFAEKDDFGLSFITSAYGIVNRNENIRSASAAGGVFSLLCEDVISRGGVVFGARYTDTFESIHVKAERMPECAAMRGIKYAQSNTDGIYEQAVSYLRRGMLVLFSGTPCQIAELKAMLGGSHKRLLTVDMVCGGVTSPSVFSSYLSYVQNKLGTSITAVDMSGKPRGWNHATTRIGSENGTYEIPAYRDPFIRAHRAGLCLLPKCCECQYRGERRESDLTLGCFLEGRKHIPELYDDKGASLVLAHTQKGRAALEHLEKRAIVREIPTDVLPQYNEGLINPPKASDKREQFLLDIETVRFDKAVERSLGPAIWCILTKNRKIIPLWKKRHLKP